MIHLYNSLQIENSACYLLFNDQFKYNTQVLNLILTLSLLVIRSFKAHRKIDFVVFDLICFSEN